MTSRTNTHHYRGSFTDGHKNISTDLCNLYQFILAVEKHFLGRKKIKLWEASKITIPLLSWRRNITDLQTIGFNCLNLL